MKILSFLNYYLLCYSWFNIMGPWSLKSFVQFPKNPLASLSHWNFQKNIKGLRHSKDILEKLLVWLTPRFQDFFACSGLFAINAQKRSLFLFSFLPIIIQKRNLYVYWFMSHIWIKLGLAYLLILFKFQIWYRHNPMIAYFQNERFCATPTPTCKRVHPML